jgi:hypothetical protein
MMGYIVEPAGDERRKATRSEREGRIEVVIRKAQETRVG